MINRQHAALEVFFILTLIPLYLYLSFIYEGIFNSPVQSGTYNSYLYAIVIVTLIILADYFIVRKLLKHYRSK